MRYSPTSFFCIYSPSPYGDLTLEIKYLFQSLGLILVILYFKNSAKNPSLAEKFENVFQIVL
jgi:hypothetical protein